MRNTRLKRLAAIGVGGVAIVSGTVFAVTGAAQASSTRATVTTVPSCNTHDDPWPGWVQGMPTGINPKTAAGVYMWHDANGWHIRVTHHTDSLRTFSGQLIVGGGTFANVTAVKLEAGDTYSVSANKHTHLVPVHQLRTHRRPQLHDALRAVDHVRVPIGRRGRAAGKGHHRSARLAPGR